MDIVHLLQHQLNHGPETLFGLGASLLILFGSGLALLIGIEQFTGRKERNRSNILLFMVSIAVFIILYNFVFLYNGIHKRYPVTTFLFFTSIYAIGPLNYLYYRSLVDPGVRTLGGQGRHLAAPALIFLAEIAFQLQATGTKHDIVAGFAAPETNGIAELVLFAGGFAFNLYQVYFIRICLQLWNEESIRRGVRAVFIAETWNVLSPIPVGIWIIWGYSELLLITGLMITSVMIFVFLFNNRFPDLFRSIERELVRKKYERSFLRGIDTELLHARLEDLMEEECLYRDYELNMQTLSERLSLSTHQLSQFLNERLGVSFNAFINEYRIKEAKELLVGQPEMTVLQICYHTGFSSKSTFNSVFKNITGITPSEFRTKSGK